MFLTFQHKFIHIFKLILSFANALSFEWYQILPKRQILDFSVLEEFADDNLKFDERAESSPEG